MIYNRGPSVTEPNDSVNLKCSTRTRDLAKKAAVLHGKTLFEYVDEVVRERAIADLERLGIKPEALDDDGPADGA